MNARDRKLAQRDPAALAREAAYQDEQRRRARERRRARPKRATGQTREERRAAEDARELAGTAAARARSGGTCEVYEGGRRCPDAAVEAHHAIGGRWKPDMEALPEGQGFVACCALHHRLLFHGPVRMPALLQAKEHALRIGSRGLLRHVEAAIRRYEATKRAGRGEEAERG